MDDMAVYEKQNAIELQRDLKYRARPLYYLNRAYARMLFEVGMLAKDEYLLIDKGLTETIKTVSEKDAQGFAGDIHYLYQNALYKAIGEKVGGKLHVGRSRNDMYFSMWRMSLREAILKVVSEVVKTQKLLDRTARENTETVIPYYTYGQPSQPGTWGHYLETVSEMLSADITRLEAAYKTVNQSVMGAAAGIGSSFPLNKERVAELLGFDGVIENTSLGNSAVDYYLETVSAFAILNTTLSRVSSDLMYFAENDVGILDFDDCIAGGSSIMPQKKNAIAPAYLQTASYELPGYFVTCLTSAASQSVFPVMETYQFFRDFWYHTDILLDNIALLRVSIEHSHVRKDVAYERAKEGFTATAGMAEVLTNELKKPFTITHDVVGGMVKTLMNENKLATKNMTPELMAKVSKEVMGEEVRRTQAEIDAMLDPLASLNAKVTGGTPKPADTLKMLDAAAEKTARAEAWLKAAQDKIASAYAKLDEKP